MNKQELVIVQTEEEVLALLKQEGGIKPVVDSIIEQANRIVFDPNTEEGKKEAKRIARMISSSKTLIEKTAKSHIDPIKAKLKAYDKERKYVKDTLDGVRDDFLNIAEPPLSEAEKKALEREEIKRKAEEAIEDMMKVEGISKELATLLAREIFKGTVRNVVFK